MTLDNLKKDKLGSFIFYHPKDGLPVTEDSPNLINFITHIDSNQSVIDIGTGSLVLPLLILNKFSIESITAVEHPEGPVEVANLNIRENNLEKTIKLLEMDYRHCVDLLCSSSFDVVVSNPPYEKVGAGRISPDKKKALATSEVEGAFEDLLLIVQSLLKVGGLFYFVHKLERFGEIVNLLKESGFEIKEISFAPTNFKSKVFFLKAVKLRNAY